VSNYKAAEYYNTVFGVKRIVLARECTLNEIISIIKQIKKNKLNLEIEIFVHGAMCVSVSGRCFISQFLFNKSANKGDCLQPCRRAYVITDPEEGHQLEVSNSYVLSPKDLCTIPFLEKLIDAGINSFKIEGRNRSPEYVKATVECYRDFIDFFNANKNKIELESKKKELMDKLSTVYNRGFSSGFFLGRPIEEWTDAYGSKATKKKQYIGKVINYFPKANAAEIKIETGMLRLGDHLMIQGNSTGIVELDIESMQMNNTTIDKAQKGSNIGIKIEHKVRKNDKVYIIS
jgi:putative protease